MANNETIFQRLNNRFRSTGRSSSVPQELITNRNRISNDILYSTNDKAEYERKLNTVKQQKLLARQWVKAGYDTTAENLASYTAVKLMYRDADLMDNSEIGTALDITSEETCTIGSDGKMLHIYSKSPRVKAMLEDLFLNRLNIHATLPMITRDMCKYGNDFMLLNINKDNGVMGWKKLPVYEIDREENGYGIASGGMYVPMTDEIREDETRFRWIGHNDNEPYKNWQIAHFRLLNDSFFLPYGVSMLHKARRAWRMWSMMEDSMLIYRLDKSIERRVFKVYVGGIDDADVQAYVQDIANNFKRTQIIDPATGQIDLRKNFMDVSSDYFIPVRSESAPNPIETLQSAQNSTSMEDIQYMQNKIFAAMRVPKTFLNFQEAQGKGQNLSIIDIRFSRMVNRVQQFILMELNKVAQIHLSIMGLDEDLTNFTLSMNNPSAQVEAQELDALLKRLNAMQTALQDPGTGIPMMSMHMALKKIMKMSDSDIKNMLNEIRLEKAMAAELATTQAIIKKTGMFDSVDRIYGDYDALNSDTPPQMPQGDGSDALGGGGMPMGGGAMPMGDDMMDLGEPGSEGGSDIGGTEGTTDMNSAPVADAGGPMESIKNKGNIINEGNKAIKSFTQRYFDMLSEGAKEEDEIEEVADFEGKTATINEQAKRIFSRIDHLIENCNFEYDKDLDIEAQTDLDILNEEDTSRDDDILDETE